MDSTNIVLTIISVAGTLSSIIFAFLAFSRNKNNDSKQDAVDLAKIKIDCAYTRDSLDRIDKRLDDYEKQQFKLSERVARLEEHDIRTDNRLEKLEKHTSKCKRQFMKEE